MIFNQDFREFIESLNKHNVRYLLIGGYAVALHGHPRYTKNLDIWTCYASREEIEIEGIKINLIDLNSLKINKKATGRHQDLADLENLI